MKKRAYRKKVKLQLQIQRGALVGCAVLAAVPVLADGPFPSWMRLVWQMLLLLFVSISVAANMLVSRGAARTDRTLDAVIRLGGSILVEEDGWEELEQEEQIDGQLLQDFREMLKDFLNLGSTREIIRTQTSLMALQSQINPHFLYNTLDVIRSEAIIEGAKNASDMIEILSRLFRYGISNKEDIVTLAEDLKNVQDYFRIQQFRFIDRYTLKLENPQDICCETVMIPKLTLQPLVENAILHAFQRQNTPGVITISLDASGNRLKIIVSDDGCGMKQESLQALRERIESGSRNANREPGRESTGIALANINKRIRLFFGDGYGLSVFSLPGAGTDVVVTVPMEQR